MKSLNRPRANGTAITDKEALQPSSGHLLGGGGDNAYLVRGEGVLKRTCEERSTAADPGNFKNGQRK